MLVIYNIT